MGYLTRFNLTVKCVGTKEKFNDIVRRLDAMDIVGVDKCMYEDGYEEERDIGFFYSELPAKWYEHSEDMESLSNEFPGVKFMLSGYGEDPEDIWIAYYCNGVEDHCQGRIVYDEPTHIQW